MRNPYRDYRHSGVEWIGDIPERWEVKRLKYVATLNPKASKARRLAPNTNVSFVPMEAIGEYGGLDLSLTKEISDVGDGYTYFRDGDVVVAKITPCFENGKGALAGELVNGIAFGTTELHVMRCRPELDYRFAFYLTLTDVFRKLGESEMYGAAGQKRVPESFITNLEHPIPPLVEQRAIAAFLDRETSRIDQLVAKHQLLIERLAEYRNAVITRAVTKGLPPNAARDAGLNPEPCLKPSGVEWIGDIPEHWGTCKIQHRFSVVNGGTPSTNNEDYWDGEIVWITPEDLGKNNCAVIRKSRRSITTEGVANSSAQVCPEGSIVMSTRAPIGHLAITVTPATTNQGCRTLAPKDDVNCAFAYYALIASREAIQAKGQGSTFMEISAADLKSHKIVNPPTGEQRAIAEYLDRKTARIDTLSERAATVIERLDEYRKALITAAVTGKIDVRESGPGSEPTE